MLYFCMASANATKCIGYVLNNELVVNSSWGKVGDQFSVVNMKGKASWPQKRCQTMYKSTPRVIPSGFHSTYSIALPKMVYAENIPLHISVLGGKRQVETPLNQEYSAWELGTKNEMCRGLPAGWNHINDALISPGNIDINISGKGVPSGHHKISIPYTIAWGLDPDQSESERLKGTWAEIKPGMDSLTGIFEVEFDVENKCDLLNNQNINLDYGALSLGTIDGNVKRVSRQVKCLSTTDIDITFTSKNVDLKNGIEAKLKVKDDSGNEITKLSSVGAVPKKFYVESLLNSGNNVVAGEFSGSSTLVITYQ